MAFGDDTGALMQGEQGMGREGKEGMDVVSVRWPTICSRDRAVLWGNQIPAKKSYA
jgi:hypothetical protein